MAHTPVLLQEVIQYLDPRPGEDFIDATFGGGGHAREILKDTAPDGKLLGIDWDYEIRHIGREGLGLETGSENLTASEPLAPMFQSGLRSGIEPEPFDGFGGLTASKLKVNPLEGRLFLECGNFADIEVISKKFFPDGANGVLFDFGFSSFHIDESGRGFSYSKNEPLDMRYNPGSGPAAAEIVNTWPERELEIIFKDFGEERRARRIAKNIAAARRTERIITTNQLVAAIGSKDVKTMARIFQALRIAVNDELENIEQGLAGAWRILKPGGRLAAISFHSLEDRIVKNFFNEKKQEAAGQILTKKPITASAEEIAKNSRARSAKLRAIRKI
ncbi:MAG: 16S rRNA (cytosine(1402)-N(4))-methyltransferase RsmH [Patescibacteria group bacterium]